jgi:hypothetical protein
MSGISTHLNFPGNTEKAFNFYRSIFGGEFGGGGPVRFGFFTVQERTSLWEKLIGQAENSRRTAIRKNVEKIELDFDSCEFNGGSYYHEVNVDNVNTINLLAPVGFSHDATSFITTRSLVKVKSILDLFLLFDFCQGLCLTEKICLYIDRFDRSNYFFELAS